MFEEKREREFVFKFKASQLKTACIVLVYVILIGVVAAQYFYPNCKRCGSCVEEAEEPAAPTPAAAPKIQISEDTEPEEEATIKNTTTEANTSAPAQSGLLPITGNVGITIDAINTEVRGDDYARVISVKYTLTNQDKDFVPTIKAWLTIDTEDVKEVTLAELEAGKSVTKTEPKLTFGYREISSAKTLKIEVRDKSGKLLVSESKTFEAE